MQPDKLKNILNTIFDIFIEQSLDCHQATYFQGISNQEYLDDHNPYRVACHL